MDGFSGVYGDLTAGEVEAMQLAIDDVGGKVLGRSVEILSADHQTKPDIGAAIARRWYDTENVKMITGLGTSSVALAVRKISQEKGLIDINTGAASSDLSGPACSETGAHWVYDTYSLAHVTGSAMVKAGGRLVLPHRRLRLRPCARTRRPQRHWHRRPGAGAVYIRSARGLSACGRPPRPVVGLAARQGHHQLDQQAGEFGIVKGDRSSHLLVFATDVRSLTLPVARGVRPSRSTGTSTTRRAWTKRRARRTGSQHADSRRLQHRLRYLRPCRPSAPPTTPRR
jgi:branched-chain amino acid transport system substrate-binding protein